MFRGNPDGLDSQSPSKPSAASLLDLVHVLSPIADSTGRVPAWRNLLGGSWIPTTAFTKNRLLLLYLGCAYRVGPPYPYYTNCS